MSPARWMGWHLRQRQDTLSLDLGYDGVYRVGTLTPSEPLR